ncbi:dual-specificity phosphatase [Reticulomyxa filosa]|uniref:Dual-specificity phosphatase n=1 Tax=Reticulomyxa filosa TaxID=46433 RepID=X6M9Q2_RETFI|nr:dual-specificity phosphatase [Reticulomyxa filosa]|eukprot:ETO10619.1 dual-specificity phosphatase [Reticulomyxa filosa]
MACEPLWNQSLCFEILEHLYLGTSAFGYNEETLLEKKIAFAINCTSVEQKYSKVGTLFLNLTDEVNTNIAKYFELTNSTIDQCIKDHKNILIFCNSAVSRSPSFVIAYLMAHKNLKLKEAIDFIVEKKNGRDVDPNEGFRKQLKEFAETLTKPKNC